MESVSDIIGVRRCVSYIIAKFDCTSQELNPLKLKELKQIVKGNASIIPELVNILFRLVQREDCDTRLAVVRICDQLFQRSHAFRIAIINALQDWLTYTIETDPLHFPLPLPKQSANMLKMETMKVVRSWYGKFSAAYPKLSSAYHFLRSCKAFDFQRVDAQLQVERSRKEELEKKKEQKALRVIEEIQNEFSEREEDITHCLVEVQKAVELLVPKFEDEDINLLERPSSVVPQKALHAYTCDETISVIVPINVPVVEINESNEAIVNSLLDGVKMLYFFNKLVLKWLNKLTKFGGPSSATFLKKILCFKSKIGIELQKCEELKLPKFPIRKSCGSASDSDEFEDVPDKEGLELDFKEPDESLAPHEIERIKQLESGANIESDTKLEGTSTNCNKLKFRDPSVPVLSFGLDLKYWGEKKIVPAEVPRNNSDCHRFWRPSDDDVTTSDDIEIYKARVITFVGKEEAYRQCCAPLSDGKLCPRHDKFRCPIHGPIIPRDAMGFPLNEVKIVDVPTSSIVSDDKEYMNDLESAVGIRLQEGCSKLSRAKKFKRISVKKESSEAVQVRRRLSAKLFNPRSIKRVSETLDAVQKARVARNFEHQFNYALL